MGEKTEVDRQDASTVSSLSDPPEPAFIRETESEEYKELKSRCEKEPCSDSNQKEEEEMKKLIIDEYMWSGIDGYHDGWSEQLRSAGVEYDDFFESSPKDRRKNDWLDYSHQPWEGIVDLYRDQLRELLEDRKNSKEGADTVEGGAEQVDPPESTEDEPGSTGKEEKKSEPQHDEPDQQGEPTEEGINEEGDDHSQKDADESRNEDDLGEIREEISSLNNELEKLEKEFEEYKDLSERKRNEIKKHSVSEFASKILKIRTTLQNAIRMEDFDEETEKRMELVLKEFDQVYTSGSIEKIDATGSFDGTKHKAVGTAESEDDDTDEIVEVKEPGYTLEDKVIKRAHVVVAE